MKIMKNMENPVRKTIPIQLKAFNQIGGIASSETYFLLTSLKLIIAITGAIRKEIVVAKSTRNFRFLPNCQMIRNAPIITSIKEPI